LFYPAVALLFFIENTRRRASNSIDGVSASERSHPQTF